MTLVQDAPLANSPVAFSPDTVASLDNPNAGFDPNDVRWCRERLHAIVSEFVNGSNRPAAHTAVEVTGPAVGAILYVLRMHGFDPVHESPTDDAPYGIIRIPHAKATAVGNALHENNIEIHALREVRSSYEDIVATLAHIAAACGTRLVDAAAPTVLADLLPLQSINQEENAQ